VKRATMAAVDAPHDNVRDADARLVLRRTLNHLQRHSTEERRLNHRFGSGLPLRPGDAWTCDHIQAVIDGGPNRERNLHPLCEWREPPKTEADMHEKSRSYRRRLRHAGIKLAPKGRSLPGTFASGWKHRMDGGWERRP
jgi:hypothetical protein